MRPCFAEILRRRCLHLRLALRERAAQLARLAPEDVPEDLEDRLASDPELADIARGCGFSHTSAVDWSNAGPRVSAMCCPWRS